MGPGTTRLDDPVTRSRAAEPPRPRPLLVPAIALTAGIGLSEAIGSVSPTMRIACHATPPILLVLFLAIRRRNLGGYGTAGLVAILALFVGLARHQTATSHPPHHIAHALTNEPILTRVAGQIVTSPVARPAVKYNPFIHFDPSPRTTFVLKLEELRTTPVHPPVAGNVRVRVDTTGLDLHLGQRVEVSGRLIRPRGPRNPGQPDWSCWYRYNGIDASLVVNGPRHIRKLPKEPTGWHRLVSALRAQARGLLFEPHADLDTDASIRLLDVMILGQRSAADRDLNEAFLRAGGMHFLAVSGFHVGVLAGAVWFLLRRILHRGRLITGCTVIAVTLLYALITEPNAPVLRATILVTLAALAAMTQRPLCVINWIALAAIAILLADPLQLFRPGFQLSFLIITALVTLLPAAENWLVARRADDGPRSEAQTLWQLALRKAARWLVALATTCAVAWIVSLPLVMLHFGRFAPWGWLGTFVLSPLVIFTELLGFATLLTNALLPPVGSLLAALLHDTTGLLLDVVRMFRHLPAAIVQCQPPPGWLVLATYAIPLIWLARRGLPGADITRPHTHRPKRFSIRPLTLIAINATALVALTWIGWLVLPDRPRPGETTLHVLAVGNGSCALLRTSDGHAAVLDIGTDTNSDVGETAAGALRALSTPRIDDTILSHANFDHFSGLPTLAHQRFVQRWMISPYFADPNLTPVINRLRQMLPADTPPPQTLLAGAQLDIGDATLDVLWPPAELPSAWGVNDRSLVIRFTPSAGGSVLLTGDIERAAMEALLDAERAGHISLKADVLIAPHHGAVLRKVTADFYAAVSPAAVVVSTRDPRPKLPRLVAEVLGPACRVVMTRDAGAVVVRFASDGRWCIETPYARDPID